MKRIKVLSWFADNYVRGILKRVEEKGSIFSKDISEFGIKGSYYNNLQQNEFNMILQIYKPDIIVLVDRTSRNLAVDIPKGIKIITFCDHFHEQFCKFGTAFFNLLPENNYLCHIILDPQNIDRDGVLKNEAFREKMFFMPFLPCVDEVTDIEEEGGFDKYKCDISVMLRYKTMDYYYGCECLNMDHLLGKLLMYFLSEIVVAVKNEIRQNETAYMEDESIRRLILVIMERLHIDQYIRDRDEFIKYWFGEVKYSIIPTEYGNCVVDWLLERHYDVRIYGAGWSNKKKYKKYAFGKIPDGSAELRKAYRYSKLNVSANIDMGIHRRVFEAMENDCLCLQAEVKREWMFSDWRHFFSDGEDIAIYHDKKELYQKIDYLLSHETERRQMIAAAKKKLKSCPNIAESLGNIIREIYQR